MPEPISRHHIEALVCSQKERLCLADRHARARARPRYRRAIRDYPRLQTEGDVR